MNLSRGGEDEGIGGTFSILFLSLKNRLVWEYGLMPFFQTDQMSDELRLTHAKRFYNEFGLMKGRIYVFIAHLKQKHSPFLKNTKIRSFCLPFFLGIEKKLFQA